MLAHPTLDKLNAMGLAGMAKAFGELVANGEAEHLSHVKRIEELTPPIASPRNVTERSERRDARISCRRGGS